MRLRYGRVLIAWIASLLWLGNVAAVFGSEVPQIPMLEKEPTKEEVPSTCGPILSDTCIPTETHKASLQLLGAAAITAGNFNSAWHRESAGGDFATLFMPLKFTYGLAKDLEVYAVVPYIHNFVGDLDQPGPHGKRSADYGGIGDISVTAKYLLFDETPCMPAVAGVFGVGFPTGNASHLNPDRLGADAIGSGAFTFTTGVNLYKWVKPFLLYSNIWLNSPINAYSGKDSVQSEEFVTFNLAAEYPLTSQWTALLEFYSTWTFEDPSGPQGFQSPSTLLGVLPGIEYHLSDKWAFSLGTAIDLAGKITSYKYTPMLTVVYSF